MKISYRWLNQYLDLSNIKVEELVNKITTAGVEVESVTRLAQGSNLVIGFVKEAKKHPDSDHLSVCQVDIGGQISQIVCGAKNVASGQKVIVALPGANLPAKGLTIAKTNIRGQESNGMICSLKELGVDDKFLTEAQKDGIEVLNDSAKVGDINPLGFLGLDDIILELKPTPNRGDILSFYSFVLEASAVLNLPLKQTLAQIKIKDEKPSSYKIESSTNNCDKFAIKAVGGITVKESPKWLKEILQSSGIRTINNIVDIGNYVMLLTGQPLHMYDADKLKVKAFKVKDDAATKIIALDDKTYNLEIGDIVITSNEEVIGIAGIMGGKSTMVNQHTKNLAIEGAIFKDIQIRKTSKRLDLISDASTRFVRGLDHTRTLYALDLAAQLLIDLADAKVVEKTSLIGDFSFKLNPILLTLSKLNSVLGITLKAEEVKAVFEQLKFKFDLVNDGFKVYPPSHRRDIKIDSDLIEEVIRLVGFDKLGATSPATNSLAGLDDYQQKRNLVRNHLLANGVSEALSYSLEHKNVINDFTLMTNNKLIKPRKLLSPITEDREYLRPSIIPSLLKAVALNNNYSTTDISLFEISKLYLENGEHEHLGITLSGNLKNTKWLKTKPVDFYTIKGLVISILELFGIEDSRYSLVKVEPENKDLHPGRSFYLSVGKQIFGFVGETHPLINKKYDINQTYVAEIDLKYFLNLKTSRTKFATPSPFPSVVRDIAVIIDQSIQTLDLIKLIKKIGKTLVKSAEVFDIYQGPNLETNKKSVAITITYQDPTKTMTEDLIKAIHAEIISGLEVNFKAKLRT